MAIHKIKSNVATTVVADNANDTWLVTATGNIDTLTTGIDADGPAEGREIIVEGRVHGFNWGITFGDMSREGGGSIVVEKGGEVSSDNGAILSRGDDQTIVNRGLIEADDAITSHGRRLFVKNEGTIDGANTAIYLAEGSGRIVNNGDMLGEAAVYLASGGGSGRVVVINNGLMDTTKGAIQLLNDGGHLIVNHGLIKTDVAGGGGRDRFVNDGGNVKGGVNLQDGNDTYVVDRSDIDIDEGSYTGNDTVKTSVDFTLSDSIEKLVLTGNADIDGAGGSGDNRIFGNSGNNRIDGAGGDDLLKGAGGRDVFVFSYHGLSDEILDFESGTDRIDMRGWDGYGLENFQDVKTNSTQMGKDLLISLGGSDDLLIHDFDKSDLDKGDFIF